MEFDVFGGQEEYEVEDVDGSGKVWKWKWGSEWKWKRNVRCVIMTRSDRIIGDADVMECEWDY